MVGKILINSFNFWGLIISVFSFGAFDIFLSIIFGYVTIKESLFCWENINLFEYNSFVEDTKNKSLKSFNLAYTRVIVRCRCL